VAQATWKREQRPPLAPKILRMLREAGLYLLVAIAVYLLISLWTYHAADPGWSHSGSSSKVENLGGRAGAWLADVLLHLFGYVAFLFPLLAGGLMLFSAVLQKILKNWNVSFITWGLGIILAAVCIERFIALFITLNRKFNPIFLVGGLIIITGLVVLLQIFVVIYQI